jgi:plastocyanin
MVGGDIDSYGYYDQGTEMDPYLILVAPDGDVIARNDDSDYGFNAEFQGVVLPEDGEYTLVATSYGSNQTFDYTLRLLNEDAEAADLRSIDRNSTATGAIDKDDPSSEDRRGFYEPVTFTGSAGENVEITMGSQRGDTYLQLLDPEGNVIAENDDSGYSLNSSLDTDLPSDGEYTIVATSFGEQDTFEYELSLNVSAGGEGGADLRSIQAGQTRDSELDESDPQAGFLRGYYEPVTFDGESGQSVTIDMSSGQGDTYLMLYGPDGNRIAQNDDYDGLNSRIEATLEEDGEYTIIATSFDDEATFDYELSLSTGEPAEAVDLRSISYGETANGSIDSADPESQSYRGNYEPVTFEGSSGDNVTIDMTSDDDTYLILLGPDGTIVAENDDYEGLDSRIETSLPSDGTYTIVATSYSSEATFDYELTLERAE